MSDRCFRDLIQARWDDGKFVCVGLDSELEKIPAMVYPPRGDGNVRDVVTTMTIFNQIIVDATKDLALTYKPNLAFYIAHGDRGL